MNAMHTDQQELFQSYRLLLFSIAYRMLGSIMDAEDCVQEVFLQWHEMLTRDSGEEIENPKAYLCTMVTRRCIDALRSARMRRESYVGLWLPEPLVASDPSEFSELAESLSMAFLLLLERLSPLERAVFLLRQVFDYDYAEIATIVGKSATYCRQVMHRARQHLPLHSSLSPRPQAEAQQVFAQFLRACQDGDMDDLLSVLSEEIVLHADGGGKMGSARNPLFGPEKVARYLLGVQRKFFSMIDMRYQPMWINGQPGLVGYLLEEVDAAHWFGTQEEQRSAGSKMEGRRESTRRQVEHFKGIVQKGRPVFALALMFAGKQIQEIDIILNPEKLQHIPTISFDE